MNIVIPYTPNSYQMKMHDDPSRFKIIVGGRRVGKSYSCLHEVLRHCLSTPLAVAWWVSPTLGDARDVGFEELLLLQDTLKPAIKYINETRMKVIFKNGASITFKSAENEKSLRGRGLTFLVIDEAAFVDPSVWKKALRPALSDKKGRAIICSTPNGRNWFWEAYDSGKKRMVANKNWGAYHWPTMLNPLISAEDLEDAQSMLSDIEWKQEYLAEFVSRAGMVYSDFSDENIIAPFTPSNQLYDFYIGADFGYASYTAIAFMAVDRRDGRTVTQFDELYLSRQDIHQIASHIDAVLAKHSLTRKDVAYFGTDPAGNAEELTSGISPVDVLRMEYGYKVMNKGSQIAPGLALVRSFIKAANGSRTFFITDNCKDSIRSIRGYHYGLQLKNPDWVKEEPVKDGIHDHLCDAIRYFFINRFDKAKYVAAVPNQTSYLVNQGSRTIMKRCGTCRRTFPSKTPQNQPPLICNECKEKLNNAR